MATLSENITRAINDFNTIKTAIEDKGVEVPSGTPTSDYAEKIESIETGGNNDFYGVFDPTETSNGTLYSECLNRYVKYLRIPDDVVAIDESAFYGCYFLETLIIGEAVEDIRDKAFYGCQRLKELIIPNSVVLIGEQAFWGGCRDLTTLHLGNLVRTIGANAFNNFPYLTSLNIPVSLTSVGADAFCGCYRLTDIYYEGTEAQWNNIQGINSCGFDDADVPPTIHYEYTPN